MERPSSSRPIQAISRHSCSACRARRASSRSHAASCLPLAIFASSGKRFGGVDLVDTSILLKRYVDDQDSAAAIALTQGYELVTSAFTEVELRSALHAARRRRVLTTRQVHAVLQRIAEERDWWLLVTVSANVLRRAEEIVEAQPLRAADAVHCASALVLQEALGNPLYFATADREQGRCALALGLPTAPLA